MKPKPRISKGTDGWQVVRPAFGFGPPEVRAGFPSWQAAGKWLKTTGHLGSASASAERTSSPENDLPWRSAETVWPVIIR